MQTHRTLRSRRHPQPLQVHYLLTTHSFGYSRCVVVRDAKGKNPNVLRSQTVLRYEDYKRYQEKGGFYRAGDFTTVIWTGKQEEASTLRAQPITHAPTPNEEPRAFDSLSFDGFGINGPDQYQTRIATFSTTQDVNASKYGPLFTAAPELLAALELFLEQYAHGSSPIEHAREQRPEVKAARAAIQKATHGTPTQTPTSTHTPNGYDPRWIAPINDAIRDRQDESSASIEDLTDELWEEFIGPMLDRIEENAK